MNESPVRFPHPRPFSQGEKGGYGVACRDFHAKAAKVAVIGGGWAGLAAAVELTHAGMNVTVFEAARQLGGRARRVEIEGQPLDNGQHILLGAYRETLRLMQLVGADPARRLKRLPLAIEHPALGFRLALPRLPAPLHLAVGLLGARGCAPGAKIAAARFIRALQKSGYRLPADICVSELLDQHQQQGRLRRLLWDTLCLAALNTAPENASAQIFANVLRDSLGGAREDTDLLLPAADLGQLFPDAASDFIHAHGGAIRLATRIPRLDPDGLIDGEKFAHVILAVAAQHAAPLLQALPPTANIGAQLAQYDYEPIGTVYARYPATVRLPCPMLGMGRADGTQQGQWAFDHGLLRNDPGLIAFVLSANGRWDEGDNAALAAVLHAELEQILGQSLPPPHWRQIIRERRATFSCRPALPRPPARTPLPGLWLAGDHLCADYPATLEGAVRSGVAVAHEILAAPQGFVDSISKKNGA